MKKIFISILLVIAAVLAIWEPFIIGEFLAQYETKLANIIFFVIGSTILLCWVGISAGFRFAVDEGWGCFAIFFAMYFGAALSLPIALYQLVFHFIFPSFKKFFICLILLLAIIAFVFTPAPLKEAFGQLEVLENFWAYALFAYCGTSAAFFWIGVPAGWKFGREYFNSIVLCLICAYFGFFLSFPIALVHLFRPED